MCSTTFYHHFISIKLIVGLHITLYNWSIWHRMDIRVVKASTANDDKWWRQMTYWDMGWVPTQRSEWCSRSVTKRLEGCVCASAQLIVTSNSSCGIACSKFKFMYGMTTSYFQSHWNSITSIRCRSSAFQSHCDYIVQICWTHAVLVMSYFPDFVYQIINVQFLPNNIA